MLQGFVLQIVKRTFGDAWKDDKIGKTIQVVNSI